MEWQTLYLLNKVIILGLGMDFVPTPTWEILYLLDLPIAKKHITQDE